MKTTAGTSAEGTDFFKAPGALALQRLRESGSGQPLEASREAPTPAPRCLDVARQEHERGSARPMRDADHRPRALAGLPSSTALAAARALDLGQSRRLVYVGGEGEALAAFLDTWRQLTGIWFGPAYAGHAARQFLRRRGLTHRVHYVAGESLDAIPAGDLVVLTAVDGAVLHSLQLLASAGAGWLPAEGRWLILQRESPHLSSLISLPLLQGQGLRVASWRPLSAGVQMLVCAPAHGWADGLADRSDRLTA